MIMADLRSAYAAIAELCAKYGVVELSVFGSTGGDAGEDSDVDLVPKEGLHWVIKEQVLGDAEVRYAA